MCIFEVTFSPIQGKAFITVSSEPHSLFGSMTSQSMHPARVVKIKSSYLSRSDRFVQLIAQGSTIEGYFFENFDEMMLTTSLICCFVQVGSSVCVPTGRIGA